MIPTEAQEGETLVAYLRVKGYKKKPDEKHGLCNTPEYRAWDNMLGRCYRRSHKHYEIYGGRGIRVATKWRMSFKSFLTDVGHKPTPSHSLDRINTNGHYEPGNVRWATATEQNLNQRTRTDNKLGMTGVSFDKKSGKYRSMLMGVEVGRFDKPEDAKYIREIMKEAFYG